MQEVSAAGTAVTFVAFMLFEICPLALLLLKNRRAGRTAASVLQNTCARRTMRTLCPCVRLPPLKRTTATGGNVLSAFNLHMSQAAQAQVQPSAASNDASMPFLQPALSSRYDTVGRSGSLQDDPLLSGR
ncbi:hypothetical protein EON66_10965 [archaeon]|nr:MAG: hypothetical protein EON66_10965 [archaeon]